MFQVVQYSFTLSVQGVYSKLNLSSTAHTLEKNIHIKLLPNTGITMIGSVKGQAVEL